MNLIIIAACFAACSAAKLDRSYLPPESAKTAGGTSEILQTPFRAAKENLPPGSYVNDFDGVVTDVDGAGTRATHTGLGASRESYGSMHSKVGEAGFRDTSALNRNNDATQPINTPNISGIGQTVIQGGQVSNAVNALPNIAGASQPVAQGGQDFNAFHTLPNVAGIRQPVVQGSEIPNDPNQMPVLEQERFHAARDRASNIITYQNDIGIKDFNYAYQTDNGISAGETGIVVDGVRSQGGYSYTGDDGQVYTVSYTADEGGYRPQGAHLPTPPPIPVEILKALEQNAKDEAAGIMDDGSYDAQKYNTESTKGNSANDYNDRPYNMFEKGPSFNGVIATINQNSQSSSKPNERYQDVTATAQNNGLQSNQFGTKINNFDFTVNRKQINNLSNTNDQNRYDSSSITGSIDNNQSPVSNNQNLETQSNTQYSLSNANKESYSTPLSQQKLEDKKETQNSLSARPSSYDAPINGPIQGTQPINNVDNRYPTQLQNNANSYEQTQQTFNPAVSSALFINTNPQLMSDINNNAETYSPNQSSVSATQFGSFSYQPIQHFGVVAQPIPSAVIFNKENKNTEENQNKIRYTTGLSQQNNDRFRSDGIFLHKQFALRQQQQINQQALSTVINNSGNIANSIPNENKDNQYFSTTYKPSIQFYNQYSNNNIANNEGLTSVPRPFSSSSTFSSTSSQLGQSGQVSQQTFSLASNDARLPVSVPSRLLSTPKKDEPEINQGSNGITQASISPFPSIMPIVSSSNNPPRGFDTLSQQTINLPTKTDTISQVPFNGFAKNPTQNSNPQNQGEVYEYQKPSQSLSEKPNDKITQTPQDQDAFNQQNQQASASVISNQSDVEQSKFESSQDNFRPKLLPSRPQFSTNSCCTYNKPHTTTSSNNNQQIQEQSNFGSNSRGVNSQSIANNAQNVNKDKNSKESLTQQAFDETGYHY